MLQYMEKIELRYDKETGEIVAPTWRQDIHCMADLTEEVARFYGYDKIGTTLPTGEATTGKLSYKLRVEQIARNVAEFCGFSEGMTYSFESPKVFDKLNIPAEDAATTDRSDLQPPGRGLQCHEDPSSPRYVKLLIHQLQPEK